MGNYILLVAIRLWSTGDDNWMKYTEEINLLLWRNERQWHKDHLRHQLADTRASTGSERFLEFTMDDLEYSLCLHYVSNCSISLLIPSVVYSVGISARAQPSKSFFGFSKGDGLQTFRWQLTKLTKYSISLLPRVVLHLTLLLRLFFSKAAGAVDVAR